MGESPAAAPDRCPANTWWLVTLECNQSAFSSNVSQRGLGTLQPLTSNVIPLTVCEIIMCDDCLLCVCVRVCAGIPLCSNASVLRACDAVECFYWGNALIVTGKCVIPSGLWSTSLVYYVLTINKVLLKRKLNLCLWSLGGATEVSRWPQAHPFIFPCRMCYYLYH